MYVVIGDGPAVVRDPDDLTSLSVHAGHRDPAELGTDLGALGVPEDAEHVRLDLARLRHLAETAGIGPGWTDRWHRMIAYARAQGWISADGGSVRAHVERENSPPR